jgi:hypothetical protein
LDADAELRKRIDEWSETGGIVGEPSEIADDHDVGGFQCPEKQFAPRAFGEGLKARTSRVAANT